MRSTFHRQRGSAHSAPHPPPARIQPPPSCHQMPARGPPRSIHNPEPRPRQPVHSAPQPPADTETGRGRWDPQPSGLPPDPPPRKQQCTTGVGWGPHAAEKERRPPPACPLARPHAHTPPRPTAAGCRPGSRGVRRRRGHRQPPHTPAAAMFEAAGCGALRGHRGRRGPAQAPDPPAPLSPVLT